MKWVNPIHGNGAKSNDERERVMKFVRYLETGCWEWQGNKNPKGYGTVWFRGRKRTAPYAMWTIYNEPLKPNDHLLHTCDNRACCNPAHLYIGTQLQNVLDMVQRNRAHAKLTVEQVRQIRSLDGIKLKKEIAIEFGITPQSVGQIINRVIRKHVH